MEDAEAPRNECPVPEQLTMEDRQDYLRRLRTWLDNARLWQTVSGGFPYYCAGVFQNGNDTASQGTEQQGTGNVYGSFMEMQQNMFQNVIRQRFNGAANGPNPSPFTTNVPRQRPTTYEFIIPPLWKRLIAESIDALILFSFKLALTFFLMESFSFFSVHVGGLESFLKELENPEVANAVALELLTLEVLHRFIFCAYETYFLGGRMGATPGKRYMGLMVVRVDSLSLVQGRRVETVMASGARPLWWQKALVRSILKNLFVGLIVPLCVTFYIFPHNRTTYDMMAQTVVVESHLGFLTMHDYHEAAPEA